MGPHSLASKFHVSVSSPFRESSSRRVFSSFRETGIRASRVELHNPQGERGVNSRDLRLFLDSANKTNWDNFLSSGIFYGVTTNPFLLKDAQVACNIDTLTDRACHAINQGATEVQLQTWGRSATEMYENGRDLSLIECGGDVVVKVPCTEDGLKVAKDLVKQNTRVTMTGLYSVHQVLLAIGVGATYAAPYLGRMDKVGMAGMDSIQKMQAIITALNSDLRLLVSSINDVKQVTDLAACGVSSFAIREGIINQLLHEPHTEQVAKEFEDAVSANTGTRGVYRRSNTI